MGMILNRPIQGGAQLGLWSIQEREQYLQSKLILNDAEMEYINSISNATRRREWLASRVLLKKILKTKEFVEVRVDPDKRPRLVSLPHKISISHTREFAAVVVHEEKEVGVDIEKMDGRILRIKNKFMDPDELKFIDSKNEEQHLYACWGAKEALFKVCPLPGVDFKSQLNLMPFDIKEEGVIDCKISKPGAEGRFLVHYQVFGECMLSYVVQP
jgi:4'-phosphopantetheinyl transferase